MYGLLVVWCFGTAAMSPTHIPCKYQTVREHFPTEQACRDHADIFIKEEVHGDTQAAKRGIKSINVVCAEYIGYGESES